MNGWQRELGSQIKEAREKAGLSQEALANKLTVKRPQLSNYENGKSAAPVNVVAEIASALDVDFIVQGCRVTRDSAIIAAPQIVVQQLCFDFNRDYHFPVASVTIRPTEDSIFISATISRKKARHIIGE